MKKLKILKLLKKVKAVSSQAVVKSRIAVMSLATMITVGAGNIVFADKFKDAANAGSKGIATSAQGAITGIVAAVIIIGGIYLSVGGEKAKELTKSKAFQVIIAIVFVMEGTSIATLIINWFK